MSHPLTDAERLKRTLLTCHFCGKTELGYGDRPKEGETAAHTLCANLHSLKAKTVALYRKADEKDDLALLGILSRIESLIVLRDKPSGNKIITVEKKDIDLTT